MTVDPFAYRVHGHRGRSVQWAGHELVELESPHLRVVISPSRGAEILELRVKSHDLDVFWHGHPEVVRNSGGRTTVALDRGNSLDDFSGGWQEVLPNAQYPVVHRGAPLGQHGEAALVPWRWRIVADEPDEASVRFSVRLRRVPLILARTVTLRGDKLRFDEEIENWASTGYAFQWGHHVAFGGPLIEAGCRVVAPTGAPLLVPPDDSPTNRLAAGTGTWPRASAPNGEAVDLAEIPADDGTEGTVVLGPLSQGFAGLENESLGVGLQMTWDPAVFPFCWMWMVYGGLPNWPLWGRERIFTLEPFTSLVEPLDEAIQHGRALTLDAGAVRATCFPSPSHPDSRSRPQPQEAHSGKSARQTEALVQIAEPWCIGCSGNCTHASASIARTMKAVTSETKPSRTDSTFNVFAVIAIPCPAAPVREGAPSPIRRWSLGSET